MLRHLSKAAAVGVAVLLAQPTMGAPPDAAPPDKDATIVVGWAGPFDTLNPATTGNRNVGPIDINIFDTLVWLTPDLQVTPDLATKWQVSDDKKNYTFTLREGV